MSVQDNLMAAFAGESQANRRYLAFARKAQQEGLPQVAKLFRAAAEAETLHALMHLRVAGGIGTTADNLQAAITGEDYEATQMYPQFLAAAQAEGPAAAPAARNFQWAGQVEQGHYELYRQAAAAVAAGGDLPAAAIWVCGVCGHTVSGKAPDACPVCKTAGKFFEVA